MNNNNKTKQKSHKIVVTSSISWTASKHLLSQVWGLFYNQLIISSPKCMFFLAVTNSPVTIKVLKRPLVSWFDIMCTVISPSVHFLTVYRFSGQSTLPFKSLANSSLKFLTSKAQFKETCLFLTTISLSRIYRDSTFRNSYGHCISVNTQNVTKKLNFSFQSYVSWSA